MFLPVTWPSPPPLHLPDASTSPLKVKAHPQKTVLSPWPLLCLLWRHALLLNPFREPRPSSIRVRSGPTSSLLLMVHFKPLSSLPSPPTDNQGVRSFYSHPLPLHNDIIFQPPEHVPPIKNSGPGSLMSSSPAIILCACMLSHSVWLFATLQTAACQAPLSMGFSRQEHWSELPFPAPGDLPNPGIEPMFLESPALAGGFFTTQPPGKPCHHPEWLPTEKTQFPQQLNPLIFSFNLSFCIGVQLIDNVIVSGAQQWLSHMYTCIHSPPNSPSIQAAT